MHKKTYQPTKDSDLIAWAGNIKEQSTTHEAEWNLPNEDVTELNTRTDLCPKPSRAQYNHIVASASALF
jgi:hypothetical protein